MDQQQRSPGQLIARAEEARRLLNGPIFEEAFEEARTIFVDEWIGAQGAVEREACHAKVIGLIEVQRQLRGIISRGEYASLLADRQEQRTSPS